MGENKNQKDVKKTPDILPAPDVVDVLRENCFQIAREYITGLDNPEDIYNNNGLFVDMLKYIYYSYVGDVLNNKTNSTGHRYNYKELDNLFNIYTSLVYKYKQNKRPSILEFSIFINIDRNTLYNIAAGNYKKASPDDINNVKRWFSECENSLTNGGSVFEIFLLKSQYRYNDNLAPVPIESQGAVLSAGELPDLSIAKIAKKSNFDQEKGTKKPQ